MGCPWAPRILYPFRTPVFTWFPWQSAQAMSGVVIHSSHSGNIISSPSWRRPGWSWHMWPGLMNKVLVSHTCHRRDITIFLDHCLRVQGFGFWVCAASEFLFKPCSMPDWKHLYQLWLHVQLQGYSRSIHNYLVFVVQTQMSVWSRYVAPKPLGDHHLCMYGQYVYDYLDNLGKYYLLDSFRRGEGIMFEWSAPFRYTPAGHRLHVLWVRV